MTITAIETAGASRAFGQASQGAWLGDFLFLSGHLASDAVTGVPKELRRQAGYPYYGSDIREQTQYVLSNVKATLEDNGSDLAHVVKTQVFLADLRHFDEFDRVWKSFFDVPPPRTTVAVGEAGLEVPGALVEVDLIAVRRDGAQQPQPVASARIPRPIANYTPAVQYGDFVFLAGQLPSDFLDGGIPATLRPDTSFPYHSSHIERQVEYTLKNIGMLLEDAGSDLSHVVKAQVFLKDLHDFSALDDVWRRVFPTPPPRTTIQICDLLVSDAPFEIDLIAVQKSVTPQVVTADASPRPLANYSQAVVAGDLVFLAGQLASDYKTGVPPEARVDRNFPFYGSEIERQTEYILKNIAPVLEAAGSSMRDIVKAQVFLTSMTHLYGFNKVWARHFDVMPARTTVGLTGDGLLVPGTLVEVDVIAKRT
jgi:enamine deaminase RidA (YjgF/YER057c/UK114 family)